jgi:hypothetical protein
MKDQRQVKPSIFGLLLRQAQEQSLPSKWRDDSYGPTLSLVACGRANLPAVVPH